MLSKIFNFMINGFSIEWMYYHSISYRAKGGIYKYISIYLTTKIERKFGCYLSPRAEIGKNLKLKHPVGIIIGEGVKIGNNVTIYQQVTLGAARVGEAQKSLYPQICNNVIVYAGAKVIGDITIGENAKVGANSVVLKNVDENCTVAGSPARTLKVKKCTVLQS